jgi:lipopolysaccharide biosynthesis glycosyltransferase
MQNFTIVNKMRYAAARGYDLHVHGAHSKIKLLQRYLPEYDYVAWVDADALFTNFSLGFEDVFASKPYEDFFVARDGNGLNAGVMLFKQTARASALLDMVWQFEGDHNHMWQEQHALQQTLKRFSLFADMAVYVPQRVFNAYPGEQSDAATRWQRGDMLVHFANCDSWAARCWDEFRRVWGVIAGNGRAMGRVSLREVRAAATGHVFSA